MKFIAKIYTLFLALTLFTVSLCRAQETDTSVIAKAPGLTNTSKGKDTLHLTKIQVEDEVSLEMPWRFSPGDSTEWALPGYNDAYWAKCNTSLYSQEDADKFFKLGFKGIGWFRIYLNIDSSLVKKILALRIENDGATAIYLDGNLLEKFGRFQQEGKSKYVNPQFRPVVFQMDTPGMHLLAVKYENYDVIKDKTKQEEGFGFLVTIADAKDAIQRYRSQAVITSVFLLAVACIFGTLAFVHFILFLFYKRSVSNCYFGLFNFAIGTIFMCTYIGMNTSSVKVLDKLQYAIVVSALIACFALSAFVNNLFQKKKWSFFVVLGLLVIALLSVFFFEAYSDKLMLILAIFASLEAIILIIIAMVRKIPGSRILGTGVLFFFAFLITIILIGIFTQSRQIHLTGTNGFYIMLMVAMAVFSIPASMSVYLARDFARVNKGLSEQLKQVELLSQKTLEQEQEKQQLLSSRKEELEHEVALRTTEVLKQKSQIEEQHEALKNEKKKSDELLLNILPAEVAEELKEKGHTKAQHYDHVTVLFTDFVNFTHISEQLSAEELVAELDECFRAFDRIMEKNGLEKIKTIGDAYLAVSGMPVYNEQHALNAISAGMEIIAFIKSRSNKEHAFEVRIGINSGPLVAGIVGVKKFAYDIWGDTVNMASRMESNSEAGKINISQSTYELIKDQVTCTYRGRVNAKNKGEVDMYFVEELIKA